MNEVTRLFNDDVREKSKSNRHQAKRSFGGVIMPSDLTSGMRKRGRPKKVKPEEVREKPLGMDWQEFKTKSIDDQYALLEAWRATMTYSEMATALHCTVYDVETKIISFDPLTRRTPKGVVESIKAMKDRIEELQARCERLEAENERLRKIETEYEEVLQELEGVIL